MLNVMVTGGSRGLGLAIATALARAGYRVIAIARKQSDELAAAIAEVEGEQTGALSFLPADLGDIPAIAGFVAQVRKEFGQVYGLVNNAGLGTDGVLANMPVSKIEELVQLNTVSPIVLTKFVVRSMMAAGSRAHRECQLHCELHGLQRSFRLRGHEGLNDRIYKVTGARGGPPWHHSQCGGAGLRRDCHD